MIRGDRTISVGFKPSKNFNGFPVKFTEHISFEKGDDRRACSLFVWNDLRNEVLATFAKGEVPQTPWIDEQEVEALLNEMYAKHEADGDPIAQEIVDDTPLSPAPESEKHEHAPTLEEELARDEENDASGENCLDENMQDIADGESVDLALPFISEDDDPFAEE